MKGGYGLRNNSKEVASSKISTGQDGGRRENETLDSIREVVSVVMTSGMAALQAELKRDLSDFRTCFREDIKRQIEIFTMEINRKIQDATSQIEGAVKRIGEMEENMADKERWDIGVKNALTQLLTNQCALQDKVSDLEGRSRRNNIRVYGLPEDSEGTSTVAFVENLIRLELGDDLDLGMECAHRALAPKPPASAPPHSMVVRFLRFAVLYL